jgi:hypothetical protein
MTAGRSGARCSRSARVERGSGTRRIRSTKGMRRGKPVLRDATDEVKQMRRGQDPAGMMIDYLDIPWQHWS